jgi:hypothetical protein
MKICAKCKQEHIESDFYKNIRFKSGLDSYCKSCKRIIQKEIRERTKDRVSKQRKDRLKTDLIYKNHISEQKKAYYWKNIETRLFYATRSRCKRRNIVFLIGKNDITIPEKCPLLGVSFDRDRYSPTIDRLIPSLGYIPGNVQVISKKANTMKNDASFEELYSFCSNMSDYLMK